jgi:oligosaccharide repeat unit polymerase
MAMLFVFGLFIFYWLVLRRHSKNGSVLALLLWGVYLCLGLSGVVIALTGGIEPIFDPNYPSTLVLLIGITLSISGFLRFRVQNVSKILGNIRGQKIIENLLILSQLLAIGFFLPFAISALTGDPNENRLFLDEKIEVLGSYGLINTLAGAASQLFSVSLVLAFIRLASTKIQGRNVLRALFLAISSLSYVIYIFAYVGRDGVIYWLMTAVALYFVFRSHLAEADKKIIVLFGSIVALVLLIPFGVITVSRFFDADQGAGWSFFEYFGAQIHNFSDYSSIDRPITYGLQSFPMFANAGCTVFGLSCPSSLDMKDIVFQQYLSQGKVPWVFGTFVSDFVGDFGNLGALFVIFVFSRFCSVVCAGPRSGAPYSLARLLLILFLFSIPFWGVFYFRFSIMNGYFVVVSIFILFVMLLQWLITSYEKKNLFFLSMNI